MTRNQATLDDLEKRRRWAVKNLCSGKGYAMKAVVAYDMLVEDVPALLAVVRAVEKVVDTFSFPSDDGDLFCPWCFANFSGLNRSPHGHEAECEWLALRDTLANLYAPKELVAMEEALK